MGAVVVEEQQHAGVVTNAPSVPVEPQLLLPQRGLDGLGYLGTLGHFGGL